MSIFVPMMPCRIKSLHFNYLDKHEKKKVKRDWKKMCNCYEGGGAYDPTDHAKQACWLNCFRVNGGKYDYI